MLDNFTYSIFITLIGMGLVFLSIILLWGGMVVLAKLSSQKAPDVLSESSTPDVAASNNLEEMRAAAAAAVAYALEYQKHSSVHILPLPETAIVTAWQAVTRARNLNSRRQSR